MSDKHILCLMCRKAFSDEDVRGCTKCPGCGHPGVPADTRKAHALLFTDQEWRILFMWARNWAEHCMREYQEGPRSDLIISGIAAEARRQQPDLPPLSVFGNMQDLADRAGLKARVVDPDGTETQVEPQRRH